MCCSAADSDTSSLVPQGRKCDGGESEGDIHTGSRVLATIKRLPKPPVVQRLTVSVIARPTAHTPIHAVWRPSAMPRRLRTVSRLTTRSSLRGNTTFHVRVRNLPRPSNGRPVLQHDKRGYSVAMRRKDVSVGGFEAAPARIRDLETIDTELHLVAALRYAARERGGPLPSIDVADALLDERLRASERLQSKSPTRARHAIGT